MPRLCTRVAPRTRESQNSQRPPTPVPFAFDRDDLFARPQDLTTVDNPLHNRQNARCLRSRCPRRQVHPELLVYALGFGDEFSQKRWSRSFNHKRPRNDIPQDIVRPTVQHCATWNVAVWVRKTPIAVKSARPSPSLMRRLPPASTFHLEGHRLTSKQTLPS